MINSFVTKVSQDKIDRIVELGREHVTQREISRMTGVSRPTIGRILAHNGVDCSVNRRGPGGIPQESIDRIIQMTLDGYSVSQIEKETGITDTTIRKYQDMNGLTETRIDGRNGSNRHGKISPELRKKVLEMLKTGAKSRDIMAEFNISDTTLYRIRRDARLAEQAKSEPKSESKPEPQPEPAADSYNISVLVTKADGTQLTRDLTIDANNEREAVGKAFQELHVKYSHSCLVVKSIRKTTDVTDEVEEKPAETVAETIEEKVEEKPMEKPAEKSNTPVTVLTSRKDILIRGAHTDMLYTIRIERGRAKMTVTSSGVEGFDVELEKINELSEEIFEVLAMISAEVK